MKHYKKVPVKKVTERAYFYNKTRSNFTITAQSILPEQITQESSVQTHGTFKKGPYKRADSDTIYTHIHHLWEISSKESIHEEDSISPPIRYLKNKLKGKLDILDRYKQAPQYDLLLMRASNNQSPHRS